MIAPDPVLPPAADDAGSAAPPPRPPRWRGWVKAALVWLALVLLGGAIQGFFFQPPLQDRLCRWGPLMSPCAAIGLGNLPTEEQQRDFAAAQAIGKPEALNAFRDKHKDSPLDAEALRALARCRDVLQPTPVTFRHEMERTLPLTPAGDVEAAAEAEAQAGAEKLCRPYVDSDAFRPVRVRAERRALDCQTLGGRRACVWRGQAVCDLEEMKPVKRCDPA